MNEGSDHTRPTQQPERTVSPLPEIPSDANQPAPDASKVHGLIPPPDLARTSPHTGSESSSSTNDSAVAQTGFFDLAVGTITAPVVTFRHVATVVPVVQAIVLVAVINALTFATQFASAAGAMQMAPGGGIAPVTFGFSGFGALTAGVLLGAPFGLVATAVWAGIVLLFAKMLKGGGSYAQTFCALSFAYVPQILSVIVVALTLPMGFVAGALAAMVSFGIAIWSFVLSIIGIREAHTLSTGRAVGAVLLPIAVLFIMGLIVIAIIISVIASAFGM